MTFKSTPIFTTHESYIRSPLNYVGGKFKLLPQILCLFPKKIDTFVDLFCGGGNVGINVNARKIILNDNLVFLIDMYKEFYKKSNHDVLTYIEDRIKFFELSLTNKDGYLSLRETYNARKEPLDLFVLLAYSFNHQIRFNNSHTFNSPFGKERSCFNSRMKDNLINFLNSLHNKNISFTSENFNDLDLSDLKEDDFVYADPPYLISTGTYNDGKRGFTGWDVDEENNLLDLLNILNERNIKFALSNVLSHKGQENLLLKEWVEKYSYNVFHLSKNYSNSSYHLIDRDKENTDEVLITNYILKTDGLST